jgi:hypothetical protein
VVLLLLQKGGSVAVDAAGVSVDVGRKLQSVNVSATACFANTASCHLLLL